MLSYSRSPQRDAAAALAEFALSEGSCLALVCIAQSQTVVFFPTSLELSDHSSTCEPQSNRELAEQSRSSRDAVTQSRLAVH